MSDILFVIPSVEEHRFLFPEMPGHPEHGIVNSFQISSNIEVSTLVTGPGPFLTTYHLGRHLAEHSHGLLVQLGICGSHDPGIRIGSIVQVKHDEFAGFGAEDHKTLIDASALGFYENEALLHENILRSDLNEHYTRSFRDLADVNGITVFKATGSAETAEWITRRYGGVVETMEGAAFYYCCNKQSIRCVQIRCVSNMAGPRERDSWNITDSLTDLRKYIEPILIISDPGHER